MIGMEILKPLAVLAGWTMVMWLWMYVTRIPAMGKAGIDSKGLVGGTGKSLDGVLPDKIQWIAHNYNHPHEAPTVFYAVALALAIIGQGDGLNATLAWAYGAAHCPFACAGHGQPGDGAVPAVRVVERGADRVDAAPADRGVRRRCLR